jgi:hypothetical protein
MIRMRPISVANFVSVFLIAASVTGWAQFGSSYSTPIEFARNRLPEGINWSSSLNLTDTGLVTQTVNQAGAFWTFWIQSQPIAAGMSWRPPTSSDIHVDVAVPELDGGYLRAYFRYSSDRLHWSSWYDLRETPGTIATARAYQAWVSLPEAAYEKYSELKMEWWETNPVWSSDEHEFCVWLATHHSEYFATEVPFIGYVQVRLEGHAVRLRLAGMTVGLSSSVSGVSSIPHGRRRASADEKWFFDLQKVAQ